MVKSKIYTTLCWQSPEELAAPSEISGRSQRCALEVSPLYQFERLLCHSW
jgi:hypothetical protein